MNAARTPPPWTRTPPVRTAPDRSPGGYFRAAKGDGPGGKYYGVPLQTTSDTAVAAVRTAYRVIDAQIERGLRAARSLRSASERQGSGDAAEALDDAERLARRATLMAVEWLESASAQPGSPIKRLLAAEYRMIGAALGLVSPAPGPAAAPKAAPGEAPAPVEPGTPITPRTRGRPPAAAAPMPRVRHVPGSARRAVSITAWQLDAPLPEPGADLVFFSAEQPGNARLMGRALPGSPVPSLEIQTRTTSRCGRWRAAVCAADGEQLGIVEIEL